MRQRFCIGRKAPLAPLRIQLNPSKSRVRALAHASQWLVRRMAGRKATRDFGLDTPPGVGEEDVGDGEIGAEDAAQRFEGGHYAKRDAVPCVEV